MAEPTLAELAKRLEALEKQFAEQAAVQPRKKDWRRDRELNRQRIRALDAG